MTAHDPFDATPDLALGRLLREHLSGADDAGFVARVRAAILAERDSSWDVLARWLRPGLVAAAAIALALAVWLSLQQREVATLADAIQPSGAPTQVLSGAQASGAEVVLGGLMDTR
jgi:hypothetical protein